MKRFRLYLDNAYLGCIWAETIEEEDSIKFVLMRDHSLAAIIWKSSNIILEEEGKKYNEPKLPSAS